MKKALLAAAAMLAIGSSAMAQPFSENFNSGIPSSWTLLNQDNLTPDPGLNGVLSGLASNLASNAWVAVSMSGGGRALITTSYFNPPGTADRWVISPSFQVTDPNMWLVWDDAALDPAYRDSLQVLVSPTAGTSPSSFTTTLYNDKGTAGGFSTKGVSLSAFNGQTIRVAFRDNSTNKFVLLLDNVKAQVFPSADLELVSISPDKESPITYRLVGNSYQLSGVVYNRGYQPVTSYTVKYQVGNSAPVSQTVSANIPILNYGSFTLNTPVNVPALGKNNVKVWVELSGDANHSNDTLETQAFGVATLPAKRLVFEEATGTWCQWCPRGAVYMDSMHKVNPHQTTLIAVHNSDPMAISAYDSKIQSTPGFSGFPGVVVDRRDVIDPSEMFDAFNDQKEYFGFADISFSKPVISGNTLTTTVDVKPALDLNGDFRLAMVITEENVRGTSSGYAQVNVYHGLTQPQYQLVGAGHNWNTAGNPVPASKMVYDFVARNIVPSPDGAAGSLPSSMTAGNTYSYNFSTNLNASWDVNKIKVSILLIRNSDGQILNSASTAWPTNIGTTASLVKEVNVYPNPAKDQANISFNLTEKTNVQIQIMDATGRVVKQVADQEMAAGSQKLTVSTSDLAAGLYHVKIQTENRKMVQPLTVIK